MCMQNVLETMLMLEHQALSPDRLARQLNAVLKLNTFFIKHTCYENYPRNGGLK